MATQFRHRLTRKTQDLVRTAKTMKIKVRVDLSKRWRVFLFAAYMTLLSGLAVEQLVAQVDDQNAWRRTVRGWEYAHAIPPSPSPNFHSTTDAGPCKISSVHQGHRIVLPIAVSSFIVTFGCWLLVGVSNRGIVKRLA